MFPELIPGSSRVAVAMLASGAPALGEAVSELNESCDWFGLASPDEAIPVFVGWDSVPDAMPVKMS